jgi:hypothetical protein
MALFKKKAVAPVAKPAPAPIVTAEPPAAPKAPDISAPPVLDATAQTILTHRNKLVDLGQQRRQIHRDFIAAGGKDHEGLRKALDAINIERRKTMNSLREYQNLQRENWKAARRAAAPAKVTGKKIG